MPQFVVPQFIDVEDKIIGPITTRQFIIGVVVALLLFVAYRFADTVLFILEAILIVGLYALIAFIKINGQPFYMFALSVIRSILRSPLRVWSRYPVSSGVSKKDDTREEEGRTAPPPARKQPQSQALSSLALLVDTGGKYRSEEIFQNKLSFRGEAEESKIPR